MNTGTEVEIDTTAEDFDPAAHAAAMVGHHYRVDDYYEVGREKVREYARAVQDYHPLHWDEDAAQEYGYDGLLAPLTFISLVGILAQSKLFEKVVTGYDLSQIMQADQTLEFHRPIRVGDRLVCDVYLHSFRQAPGGADMIVTKNIVTSRDELVLTTYTTLAGRSGADIDPNLRDIARNVLMQGGMSTPEHRPRTLPLVTETDIPVPTVPRIEPSKRALRFEDVSEGDELPPRIVQLTRGDLVNYAGVSGDPNPIHWSDEVVKRVGLDNVVAHGMLTMGLGGGFVTSWLGDPGAVKEYNVRFTSMVYVPADAPAEIEYSGKVKSVDPETRTAVVAITAKSEGRRIFGRATATVQLS
ncbi:fused (3R)-hydroxyacyl-ACP dehydratase subunits HadA/HadB [Nocardia sp. CDC159]|uniref:Fused (3R)-hydroxyacyl-ACP dehydratase subunits HadA/HadB n=1 Tax=Nocardia pulmonis TaxID=2951408 RepID=A0A9X2IZK8_9NOCA|nr:MULTISPECIES: fused (3R)-hydroxyacyl-ACP dehydratase subunits HadA/HadB [Nocardia]MCM6775016.1 fused (3R)-hydroxyacyl-ACP dehydratase subunits HadA/HadB [Nocardia pulmonis]MCM6789486.1 fused (3R)-hydroxyacyl-ACP dehydratase subunits HadA/HadB [Nocardia sp. CDC159]